MIESLEVIKKSMELIQNQRNLCTKQFKNVIEEDPYPANSEQHIRMLTYSKADI